MATSPSRFAWDACTWIALIQRETNLIANGIDRYTRSRIVVDQAAAGKIEIICSALCIAEVCKKPNVLDTEKDEVAAYFEHDYLIVSALRRDIAERARSVMMLPKVSGLKPQDACHIATALDAPRVTILHTFDEKLRKLSREFTKDDGTVLEIDYPDVPEPVPPLLQQQSE